jgi:hypothetical protein
LTFGFKNKKIKKKIKKKGKEEKAFASPTFFLVLQKVRSTYRP